MGLPVALSMVEILCEKAERVSGEVPAKTCEIIPASTVSGGQPMARVMITGDDDPDIYYVVDDSVGLHGVNRRDDVLLVQFFLRVLSDREKRNRPPDAKDLAVNGAYTDLTGAYIKQYADEHNQTPLYDDRGLVKRVLTRVEPPGRPAGLSGAWIMERMNEDYQRFFPKTGLPHFPLFPNELRKKFYI